MKYKTLRSPFVITIALFMTLGLAVAVPARAQCSCTRNQGGAEVGCVSDQAACDQSCGGGSNICTCTGSCAAPAQKPSTTPVRELTNPLGTKSIPELIGRIATIFTGISGTVALLMFVYGGLLWLTSGGNEERIAKGKKIFTWATIGLVVIFSAYAIVRQIFSGIGVNP